jgi:glycosyltransferase involved in cell wall biosynthesis
MATANSVLHVVPTRYRADGVPSASERYAFELARRMADHVPTLLVTLGTEECSRLDRGGSDQTARPVLRVVGGTTVEQGGERGGMSLVRAVHAARIVHCHHPVGVSSSAAVLAARLAGRKTFVTYFRDAEEAAAYPRIARWVHGCLHPSEYSRMAAGQARNPHAHVIGSGVDVERFTPAPDWPGPRQALFVGSILPQNGLDDLVAAATDEVGVTILGRPCDRRFLSDLQWLASGRRVAFTLDADEDAVVRAYQRALCVVLPGVLRTRYGRAPGPPELVGQSLLEGMACGVPAVCTNVASLPEIVEDGVTGFVVPPNRPVMLRDRLRWLQDHPDERRRMGAAARQRVLDRFTWSEVVRRCLSAYESPAHDVARVAVSREAV